MSPIIESLGGAHGFGLFAASGGTPIVGAYDALATVTLSSTQSAITFSGIPQGYSSLQLRVIARCSGAYTGNTDVTFYYNGDITASHYYSHYLRGDGSSATAYAANNSSLTMGSLDNNNTANVYSASIIDIVDYANPNKNTVSRCLEGWDANGSGQVYLKSAGWTNTSPVTSFVITFGDGNVMANSSFSLYGVR